MTVRLIDWCHAALRLAKVILTAPGICPEKIKKPIIPRPNGHSNTIGYLQT